jgi:hypothetical protein
VKLAIAALVVLIVLAIVALAWCQQHCNVIAQEIVSAVPVVPPMTTLECDDHPKGKR